jgi:hypothetical protein
VRQEKGKGMDLAKGPTEAIVGLLAEELRQVIYSLPSHLQESVPEQLKLDTHLGVENDTPRDGQKAAGTDP